MKITVSSENILIVPETNFEKAYLERYRHRAISGFLRCGLTPKDIVGLSLQPGELLNPKQDDDASE